MWMDWLLLEDKIGKCLKIQLITNNTSVVKEEDESEEMAEKIPYKHKKQNDSVDIRSVETASWKQ